MTDLRVIGIDRRGNTPELVAAKFHSKLRPAGECIEWTGEVDKDGYGKFAVRSGQRRRKRWMAHRYAYSMMVGEIPEGWEVDHVCRNRLCVRLEHLEAVTAEENHRRWCAAITHCPAGHEYTAANTRGGEGTGRGRTCRACERRVAAAYRAANRERVREAARRYREKKRASA